MFTIDFFELMFLAEATIPPRPIARATFFQNLSETYYHQMSEDERYRAFNWITNEARFDIENEDCEHFYARFNPKNQFNVQTSYKGKNEAIKCYKYKGNYHTSKCTFINQDHITEIEHTNKTQNP